jgi:hypothetical protein
VSSLILSLHCASTLALLGLIWFVQVVHYPLFASVGRESFVEYERLHQVRTTWVVAPLMAIEALSASLILFSDQTSVDRTLAGFGWILVLLIWLSTAFLQVPLHRRLAAGYDSQIADRLVKSNWVRTIAWTLRSFIALLLLPLGASG